MTITRQIIKSIEAELSQEKSKIIVIYGARQVGKTTLVETILEKKNWNILRINGDLLSLSDETLFQRKEVSDINQSLSGYDLLFVDEGQKIRDIGTYLKVIHDHNPDLKIIVTGSSALDLASRIQEPLTGRTDTYLLYPISQSELQAQQTNYDLSKILEQRMIYGSYPDVFSITATTKIHKFLYSLSNDYLYKDIITLDKIRNHNKIRDLLRLLSFQIGSEVSYSEIGQQLGLSSQTVGKYIDLLEKSFVIFSLRGLSRNLRKEVTKMPKIYFVDLGIRNALIENFTALEMRNDVGQLWENFVISERRKRNAYSHHFCSSYFWRTYTGAELDYVEEYDGHFHGHEIKWKKTAKAPKAWIETYKGAFECITKDNYLEFVSQHPIKTE